MSGGDALGLCVGLPMASGEDSNASWLDDVLPALAGRVRLCSQPLLKLLEAISMTTKFGRVVSPAAGMPVSLLRKAGTMGRDLSLCTPNDNGLSSVLAAASALLLTECSICRAFLAPVLAIRSTVATTYSRFSTKSSTPTASNPAALATFAASSKYKHPVAVAATANMLNTCRATSRSDHELGLCTQAALLTSVQVPLALLCRSHLLLLHVVRGLCYTCCCKHVRYCLDGYKNARKPLVKAVQAAKTVSITGREKEAQCYHLPTCVIWMSRTCAGGPHRSLLVSFRMLVPAL